MYQNWTPLNFFFIVTFRKLKILKIDYLKCSILLVYLNLMCMYVCMCVCMCACVCVCVYVCVYVCSCHLFQTWMVFKPPDTMSLQLTWPLQEEEQDQFLVEGEGLHLLRHLLPHRAHLLRHLSLPPVLNPFHLPRLRHHVSARLTPGIM